MTVKAELVQQAVGWLEKMSEAEIQSFIREKKQAACPHANQRVCGLWMACDDCGANIEE